MNEPVIGIEHLPPCDTSLDAIHCWRLADSGWWCRACTKGVLNRDPEISKFKNKFGNPEATATPEKLTCEACRKGLEDRLAQS